MIIGYAYHITYPRRPEQEFVTLDPAHVAKELSQAVHIRWAARVRTVRYHGDGALPVAGRDLLGDVLDLLPEKDRPWYAREAGMIASR